MTLKLIFDNPVDQPNLRRLLNNREIDTITLDEVRDLVLVTFKDGGKVRLRDAGYCCCEHRYMSTDDCLSDLNNSTLLHITVKPGPDMEKEDQYSDEHETAFLEIQTSSGFATIVNHNEHNGYYGGFNLVAEFD